MGVHNSIGLGKEITITIDGKVCKSTYGKTILQVARENGIYIPTMCYLTKVKPIASCRMCIVNVEGVDGAILSCQEKAVDGAVVTTNSDSLFQERQNIMKLYDVNHPLECGVCDQSGECDLQNKTLEFGVDNQTFTARDQARPVENWGHVSYDPSLCIMCEKCVRVSTEITGDEALQIKFGGYSSEIINVKPEKNYASLGEAAAVCPVGALVDTNFKYTSNAWELKKIPSSCPHCGGGCQLHYDVKPAGIENRRETIYRVGNNYEFSTLCPAGRYAFDYDNTDAQKDPEAFKRAVEAFKKAKTIRFSPMTSNEEALILQKLKEKYGYRLISPEAKAYRDFMDAYGSITGKQLFSGNLKSLSKSQGIIILGTRLNDDHPVVKYHVNMASKWERARVAYIHPIEDPQMQTIVTQFIKNEVGSEEGVAALLADTLLKDTVLPESVRAFLDDLDIGQISAESNVGEEELEALKASLRKRHGFSMVVGEDLYAHPRAKEIAKIIALFEKYGGYNVICVPPAGNAMGISRICDLDDEEEGFVIGYNVAGDFTLSAMGGGDLDMPAMTQQEGTLTTFEKRVVPMHVATPYGGYVLNDIANALGLNASYTIDYTVQLPQNEGYRSVEFDTLPDYFDVTGEAHRGYILEEKSVLVDERFDEVAQLEDFDGTIVYQCNPQEHFSPFTAMSKELSSKPALVGSSQFATAAKLQDGEMVSFEIDGVRFERVFKIDTSMKGTVALNPTYDMGLSWALLSSYRFSRVKFERMNNEKVGS